MIDAFFEPFFQRVLLAGLLSSVACGVIGSYVVVTRMSSISGAISHAAFGGVGLGYLLGFDPMAGAVGFSLASGLGIGVAYRRFRSSLDALVSIVWPVGMALGILFVSLAPGYAPDLTSYLFGSLLFVPWEYVAVVGALDVLVLGVTALFHRHFEAVAFDEEFAEVTGLKVDRVILLLLALVALTVVTLIRVVGVILAIALLTLPAETARPWARGLPRLMLLSGLAAGTCTVSGMVLSYELAAHLNISTAPGPVIILLGAVLYVVSSVARRLKHA